MISQTPHLIPQKDQKTDLRHTEVIQTFEIWFEKYKKDLFLNGLRDKDCTFCAHTTFSKNSNETLNKDFGFFNPDDTTNTPTLSAHLRLKITQLQNEAYTDYCEWVQILRPFLLPISTSHELGLMIAACRRQNVSATFNFHSPDLGNVLVDSPEKLLNWVHS